MTLDPAFWHGKRVLLTGHTGFKGSWLSLWLQQLGARCTGVGLAPSSSPNMFDLLQLASGMESRLADIRDYSALEEICNQARPEIVFHLAAQALVRDSYADPRTTFETNVLGTVNLLDSLRRLPSVKVIVIVTTDKCYENNEHGEPFRETDRLGGDDPYSSSKACAELVTHSYRKSFFSLRQDQPRVAVATARAGNVIGGGDWAKDRVIPDFMRAAASGQTLTIRAPEAVRPWQLVLEPLCGYLVLAQHCWHKPSLYAEAWNFGPAPSDTRSVRWIVEYLNSLLPEPVKIDYGQNQGPKEKMTLRLDSNKAHTALGWKPRCALETALQYTCDWYQAHRSRDNLYQLTLAQIDAYMHDKNRTVQGGY